MSGIVLATILVATAAYYYPVFRRRFAKSAKYDDEGDDFIDLIDDAILYRIEYTIDESEEE